MARSSNWGAAAGMAPPHLLKEIEIKRRGREECRLKRSMHKEREFRMEGQGENVNNREKS